MTPELNERLKQSCKLMAEKIPEKWIFDEASGWLGSVDRMAKMFYPKPTQDDIDTLASLLPEPRRILLERYRIDEHPYYLMVRFYDELYQEISMALYTGTQNKLSALVEGFCTEVERQLK